TGLPPPPGGDLDSQRLGDSLLVGGDPNADVGEHLLGAPPGPPLIELEQPGAVGKIDGDVPLPRLGDWRDRQLVAGPPPALRRLQQREAALAAAAGVHGLAVPLLRVEQLPLDQVDKVFDVEEIAYLLA